MKNLAFALVLVLGFQVGLRAQQLSQSQNNTVSTGSPSSFSQGMSSKQRSLHSLPPQSSGVLPELLKQGPVVLSPLAPMKEGLGERYLSANPYMTATSTRHAPTNATPYAGIKLIGWDF